MAVVVVNQLPPMVGEEQYRQVSEKVNSQGVPDGLIFHTGFVRDGSIEVVDVWESREQFEAFAEATLGPAVAEVMGGEMQGPPAEPQYYEPLDTLGG